MDSQDKKFLGLAIEQARKSVVEGGFPAGAVVVKDAEIISEGISIGFALHDPTSHAETAAIREACKQLETINLKGATLYESVECCVMCFSVAYWAGISKIIFAVKKTEEMVSKGYYEGRTNNQTLNKENTKQIELIHAQKFEKESFDVIEGWEKQGGFSK